MESKKRENIKKMIEKSNNIHYHNKLNNKMINFLDLTRLKMKYKHYPPPLFLFLSPELSLT